MGFFLHGHLWRITHVNQTQSKVEHVRGTGVVGYQPTLHPGKSFSYTSGAILSTPSGIMDGEYLMMRPNGTQFQALIPPFLLAIPSCVH
jgi:ApaG protein